jgi:hypothetical protein
MADHEVSGLSIVGFALSELPISAPERGSVNEGPDVLAHIDEGLLDRVHQQPFLRRHADPFWPDWARLRSPRPTAPPAS